MNPYLAQILLGLLGIALGSAILLAYFGWQRRRDERRWRQQFEAEHRYLTRADGTVYPARRHKET